MNRELGDDNPLTETVKVNKLQWNALVAEVRELRGIVAACRTLVASITRHSAEFPQHPETVAALQELATSLGEESHE